MNKRGTVIGWSIVLLAAVVIGAVALLLPRSSAAQNPTTDSRKRITVIGKGEVKVTPDIARITIGVQTEAKDTTSALNENNAKMEALIAEIKKAGVADADIQTSGFSVYPTYNYDSATPQITGYQVSNTVTVKVSIKDAGGLLDKVVAAGANNVSNIAFDVSDPQAALAEARKASMADAKARADQFAAAGNAQVGEVLVISEQLGQTPVFPAMALDQAAGGEARAVPIQPGQQTQTIEVQVTFELK